MDNISSLDLIIGSIVVLLGLKGFFNGFLKEIFSLLGLILGVYVGSSISSKVALEMGNNFLQIENKTILTLIVFLAILAFIWLTSISIGSLLSKLTKLTGLGFINNALGFIIGGGKYFVIFAVIITAFSNVKLLHSTITNFEKNSLMYPYLIVTGDFLIQLKPQDFNILKMDQNNSLHKITNSANKLKKAIKYD
ncbi:MAG: CvpA family protein [Sulfurovaceae bacterium]|nr:CvpA family protein [Sulfurovaceae bacterium]MDD5548965.1 CvpA family protein [Sulfurovaceae bacterium]